MAHATEQFGYRCRVGPDGNEYTATFQVTSDRRLSPAEAMMAAGIPLRGDPFRFAQSDGGLFYDPTALLQSKEVEENAAGNVYTVRCEYKPPKRDNDQQQDPDGVPQPPWELAPKLSFGYAKYEVPAEADVNGKKYVNAVGERLEHYVSRTNVLIYVEVCYSSVDPAAFGAMADKVNRAAFLGYPPKSVKFNTPGRIEPATYTPTDGEPIGYWRVQLEFEYNPRLWVPTKKANIGTFYKKTVNGRTVAVLPSEDNSGVPTGAEVFLNAQGEKVEPADSAPLEFVDYQDADFSGFGF